MNSVNLIGRITKELDSKITKSGTTVCNFSIACNEKYNNEEKTHFFNCVSFGKTAEFIDQYCKKGGRIAINGKLAQRRWETQDGQKRSTLEIVIFKVVPIDWKEGNKEKPLENQPEENPFSDDSIPF